MSPLRKTAHGWEAQIGIITDADGGFGRQCPDCGAYFKLFAAEYGHARRQHRLTCPACAFTTNDENFATADQRRRIKAGTEQFLQATVHEALADFSRGFADRTVRLGPNASIRYTAHHNPPPLASPLPTYLEQRTLRTFTCPNGGHRAVIHDLLTACPYCGPNTPPRAVFDDNLAAMRRLLDTASSMTHEQVAAGEQTTAVEQALTRVVGALQSIAKQLHTRAGKQPPVDNPWQNADRLRRRWSEDFGQDPFAGIGAGAEKTLRLAFNRRHVIEHNGSVVDERYVKATGEGRVGRRLRVTAGFVVEVHRAAEQLATYLERTSADVDDPATAG